jgi:OsmC-like protein
MLGALVACAGVPVSAVATAMGVKLRGGRVVAEGHWDARGTLGVDREAPVGLTDIALTFELDTDADTATDAASGRDERAFLRDLPNLARAASTYSYSPDRSRRLIPHTPSSPSARRVFACSPAPRRRGPRVRIPLPLWLTLGFLRLS